MWQQSVEERGFTVIPDVLTPMEVAQLLEECRQLMSHRSRAGVRHALRHAPIAALARDSRLAAIAQDILGDKTFPFRATLFDKSQNANWLVVWHQDTALPLRERRDVPGWGPWSRKENVIYAHAPTSALCQVLALRVHLDDSTAQNGPLRVLPGTHKLGVLSDDAVHELAAKIPATDCLVPKGGVLTMRPLLIHSSSKSQAPLPRRVLHIEFAASPHIAEGLELAIA